MKFCLFNILKYLFIETLNTVKQWFKQWISVKETTSTKRNAQSLILTLFTVNFLHDLVILFMAPLDFSETEI